MKLYEMEGFLRGKCLPGDLLVGESNAEYLVRKLNEAATLKAERDALADRVERLSGMLTESRVATKSAEERADALAVENAEMRSVIDAAIGVANNSSGIAGWHLNGEIADWDEILPELNIETPATSAALAAIEARGVEKYAELFKETVNMESTGK